MYMYCDAQPSSGPSSAYMLYVLACQVGVWM